MSPRSHGDSIRRSVRIMVRRLPNAPPVLLALVAVLLIALLFTGIGYVLFRS